MAKMTGKKRGEDRCVQASKAHPIMLCSDHEVAPLVQGCTSIEELRSLIVVLAHLVRESRK